MMFTQMNAKREINIFKQRTVAAMIKELIQLDRGVVDGKPVVIPIDPNLLTFQDKKLALEAVHLVKEKEEAILKEGLVQMVADKDNIQKKVKL